MSRKETGKRKKAKPAPSADEVRRRLERRGLRPIELYQEPPSYLENASEAFCRGDGSWEVWVPKSWKTGEASGLVWCLCEGDTPVVEVLGRDDEPQLVVRDSDGGLRMRMLTQVAAELWRES